MSDPAIKIAVGDADEYTVAVKGLTKTLSDAGEYGYRLKSGKYINSKTIREEGEALAEEMGYMSNGRVGTYH